MLVSMNILRYCTACGCEPVWSPFSYEYCRGCTAARLASKPDKCEDWPDCPCGLLARLAQPNSEAEFDLRLGCPRCGYSLPLPWEAVVLPDHCPACGARLG